MNRLEPSATCRVCGLNMRGLWNIATLVRMRVEWNRMMGNGQCDNCQHDRLDAAIEYENALAEIRLVIELGATWDRRRPPSVHPALRYARHRRRLAEARCVELKMWPATEPVREEN